MDELLQSTGFDILCDETLAHHFGVSEMAQETSPIESQGLTISSDNFSYQQTDETQEYTSLQIMMSSQTLELAQGMPFIASTGSESSGISASQTIQTPLTPGTASLTSTIPVEASQDVPILRNVVSSAYVGCKLDLKYIVSRASNAEYNPQRFNGVIMRIREPRTTSLIFKSGKLICTGAKTVSESKLALRKFARILQKLGYPAGFLNFRVHNMVGSYDVKFPIRLEALSLFHNKFCSYEPELFPGLAYRMIKPNVAVLIFSSGKIVITGAKEQQEINEAFTQIYPLIKNFKKKSISVN